MTDPNPTDCYYALMKQCGFTWAGYCGGCGAIIFRRRGPRAGQRFYCDAKKCQTLKKLGHDKPVTFESIPGDTSCRDCYSEIRKYEGGYTE